MVVFSPVNQLLEQLFYEWTDNKIDITILMLVPVKICKFIKSNSFWNKVN